MNKFTKVIKVLLNTLVTIIIILGAVFLLLYAIKIRPFVVESGSMEPNIHVGSVCFVNQRAKYENIKQGDIIAFNASSKIKVTHRAVEITEEGITTKGDANENNDGVKVTKSMLIGKTLFSIPKAGYVIRYIQTPKGMIYLGIGIIVIVLLEVIFETGDTNKPTESTDKSNKKEKEPKAKKGKHQA